MQPTCTNCGSDKIIPEALVHAWGNPYEELTVGVQARPNARVFKREITSSLRARVCGACGYTEFIAQRPKRLYEAYLRSLES